MKRYAASLLCAAMLAGILALFAFVVMGGYERFALDGAFAIPTLDEILSPRNYRKTLIAGFVALGFAALDVQSLTTRGEAEKSADPKPCDAPLGFAALRARRYCLLLFAFFYTLLVTRLLPVEMEPDARAGFTVKASLAFAAVFAITRRPLDWTVGNVFQFLMAMVGSFLKGFNRG